jgi:DNA polymerase-3 subunit epsilon
MSGFVYAVKTTLPNFDLLVNETIKTLLALLGFLLLVAGLELAAGYAVYYDLEPENRQRLAAMLASRMELLLELGALRLAILGIAFVTVYQLYAKGSLKIVEGIRIILNANRSHRIEVAGPSEIRSLAQATNALADYSETLAHDFEAKIVQAKSSAEAEKNRLAALMSELSQGVLVCNIDGRILLYNERARHLFGSPANGRNTGSVMLIGLGRSIFTLIDRSVLAHELEHLQVRLEKNDAVLSSQFVITTQAGQLIRVRMAPVLATASPPAGAPGTVSGFVMTLENITHIFDLDSTRDMLLQSFTEGSRSALANIRAAVETLMSYPNCEREQRDRFIQVISEEVRVLSGKLDQTTTDYADSLKTRWPLEEMRGGDIIAAARRRIESRLGLTISLATEALDDSLWIKADSYTLVQALTYLAGRLKHEHEVREIRFNLARHGRIVELDLIWSGSILPQSTLDDWEMDPMRIGGEDSPLTLHDVTERHAAEIVLIAEAEPQRSFFRFLLPLAKPARPSLEAPMRHGESRPAFYDFDLFQQTADATEFDHLALADLTYTVMDTETTGLDPSAGDEIIAIGAVRIVNGRLLRHETYEQLVDPKRPIAAVSEAIHGISNEMLRGQPTIDEVLPQFYEYCADAVLVGHNVAFDLRFLQLKEARTGIRFTQPVLDTLLLSEVLHPQQESHALEAIAERLGVTIVARHTALGDALVTGEIFLRMIPLLAAHGIRTLRDARQAAEKIYARVEY